MIAGDYYLQKYNGTTIDEKIFNAQAGKAIGFDVSLNPVMLPIVSLAAMSNGYIPKYDGLTLVNSFIRQAPNGIGIDIDPLATFHVEAAVGNPIALFTSHEYQSTAYAGILIQYDYYGGEIGIIGQSNGTEKNLACLHQDGAIGIGYTTLKVYESNGTIGLNITAGEVALAQIQINEFNNVQPNTAGALLIYSGQQLIEGLAINVKTWSGYDALTVSCGGTHAAIDFGINSTALVTDVNIWGTLNVSKQIVSTFIGAPPFVVGNSNMVVNLNANYLEGFAASNFSTATHTHTTYVPYTGANANVNIGNYGLTTVSLTGIVSGLTITGGSNSAGRITYIGSSSATVLSNLPAHIFKGGNAGAVTLMSILHSGCIGIGTAATTVAFLNVGGSAGTIAQMKLTAGTLIAAPFAGALEFDGTALYFSPSTTRYAISLANHTHAYEPALGNPAGNGYILSSSTLGVRSWIANTGHNPVTISGTSANGLSLTTQVLSLAAASTSVTGALTSTDWNTFNNKVSFPGFGTSHITAAYGDHTHSNYDNYNQWTFQPETFLGVGASYTISSGFYLQLKAGSGMDLSHSILGSTVTVTLTSSGGFPGFGTTHSTCAYGDHFHSNYDNYNQWTLTAYNGAYVSKSVISGQEITLQAGANVEWDTADFAADGILVMNVINIPTIVLTGYTYGSTGLIAATDSLKIALSKLQTQMPKTLYYDIADYVNVGSSATDLENYTLPANTLSSDGQRLELHYSGSSAANTTSKTIQFYFGGTSYIVITNSNASSLNWFLRITIIRYSSTYFRLSFDGNWNVAGSGNVIGSGINYATTNVIKLTAQAGASNEIICKLATIAHFSS